MSEQKCKMMGMRTLIQITMFAQISRKGSFTVFLYLEWVLDEMSLDKHINDSIGINCSQYIYQISSISKSPLCARCVPSGGWL